MARLYMVCLPLLWIVMDISAPTLSFKEQQLRFVRVKNAYSEKGSAVEQAISNAGIQLPYQIFIRGFKQEELLEVWAKERGSATYQLVRSYAFCSNTGTLGPKRKEGDLQIPEGIYHINHFNPLSNFHLSLGINYPNESDLHFADRQHPGSAIYIHGNCVTIGCIPITDDKIKELYIFAVEAKNAGQERIPVHIFPIRLPEGAPEKLAEGSPTHLLFWKSLQSVYLDFEKTRSLRSVGVDQKGYYSF